MLDFFATCDFFSKGLCEGLVYVPPLPMGLCEVLVYAPPLSLGLCEGLVYVPPLPSNLEEPSQRITTALQTVTQDMLQSA